MPHYRFSFKSWVCSSIIVLSYFYFWNWTFIFTFLSTFFYSSCAFTGIVVNEYHKTSWSSTWEFSHVGGECKKFVLFQWSVSILFVESCGELDIILTRIIPAKMIDNTQTSNKNTLNESSVYVYSNILPHFILNILVTWRHQYLNGSTNKSSL